jgi:H+-translocating NAD(P) transhydrogenase subunit alpha
MSSMSLVQLTITMTELSVFVLAGFLGYQIVTKVPPLVHTPLLSATNAICGISIVGALVEAGARQTTISTILGVVAVTAATINIVGGFLMTDRMLNMFSPKKKAPSTPPAGTPGLSPDAVAGNGRAPGDD